MQIRDAVAQQVAEELEQEDDVLATSVEENHKGPYVNCVLQTHAAKRRLQREVHEYPAYIIMEVDDGG